MPLPPYIIQYILTVGLLISRGRYEKLFKSAESSVASEDYTSESRREDNDRAAMRLYQNLMKKLMR